MKKFLIFLIIIVLVFSILSSSVITSLAVSAGELTATLSWVITDDGVLTITGSGDIPDFSYKYPSPFKDSEMIKKVVVSEGVTSIGDNVFFGCKNLKTINIPETVTSISPYAFDGCSTIKAIEVNANNNKFSAVNGVLFNKSKSKLLRFPINKHVTIYEIPDSVIEIGELAFAGCKNISSVVITNRVKNIGFGAFSGCLSLTSVDISSGISYISESCFYGCTNLTSLSIPDSVVHIGGNAFANCENLVSVKFGEGITDIGEEAFMNCISLNYIEIPDSVKSIGFKVFSGCTALRSILLPDTIENIEHSAFKNTAYYNEPSNWKEDVLYIDNHLIEAKKSLSGDYKIEMGTINIADEAFYGCVELIYVEMPLSLKKIGDSVFSECSNLTYVEISETVDTIGNLAFSNCGSLKLIDIPDSVTYLGNSAFGNCTGLTVVSLGNGLSSVSKFAFYNCDSLISVRIPDGITVLETYAFNGCDKLDSVAIPRSVRCIEDMAFYGCKNLKSVFYSGSKDLWATIDFSDNNYPLQNAEIHYNSRNHTYKVLDFVEATCTESGYINNQCEVCGVLDYQYIPAIGHNFSTGWYIDVEPTEQQVGEKSHHCVKCGVKSDITPISYNPTIHGMFFVDTQGFTCNGEITYLVNVKGGTTVSGSIFTAVFDTEVLEPVEEKCGAYTRVDSDGNEILNYDGFYTSGLKYGTNDTLVVAHTNASESVKSKDSSYLKFTFKLKDVTVKDVEVDFYCIEFTGSHNISNNDYEVLASHSLTEVCVPGHVLDENWKYDLATLTKECVCTVCSGTYVETIELTDVLALVLNDDATGYVIIDCLKEYSGKIVVPTTYNGLPVTAIAPNAFAGCNKITSILISDKISSIGYNAFSGCDSLIVFCDENSVAHIYSINNNLPWIANTDSVSLNVIDGTIYSSISNSESTDFLIKSGGIDLKTENGYIGTGATVDIIKDEFLHSQFTFVILGDTNGDGVCDVLDCFDIERTSNGNMELSGVFAEAADINDDDVIDAADYQSIINIAS